MEIGEFFGKEEADILEEIILSRRDVRGNRFINKPIENDVLDRIFMAALNAPSVGFSQPWEFVVVDDDGIKEKIRQTFQEENRKAKDLFKGEKQEEYMSLKLEGIFEAPLNIAVFYKPSEGPVLGQTTMSEAGLYSVVCAIQNMWLMARALNLGMGWVSIVDPDKVKKILNAPEENQLVAYLCLGYVDKFLSKPELEMRQWEKRKLKDKVIFYNKYL